MTNNSWQDLSLLFGFSIIFSVPKQNEVSVKVSEKLIHSVISDKSYAYRTLTFERRKLYSRNTKKRCLDMFRRQKKMQRFEQQKLHFTFRNYSASSRFNKPFNRPWRYNT